jgi:hypothetical protein
MPPSDRSTELLRGSVSFLFPSTRVSAQRIARAQIARSRVGCPPRRSAVMGASGPGFRRPSPQTFSKISTRGGLVTPACSVAVLRAGSLAKASAYASVGNSWVAATSLGSPGTLITVWPPPPRETSPDDASRGSIAPRPNAAASATMATPIQKGTGKPRGPASTSEISIAVRYLGVDDGNRFTSARADLPSVLARVDSAHARTWDLSAIITY